MTTVLPYLFTVGFEPFDAFQVKPASIVRLCQNRKCNKRLSTKAVWTDRGIFCGDKCADVTMAHPELIGEMLEVWDFGTGERTPRPLKRGSNQIRRPVMAKKNEEQNEDTVEAPAETPKPKQPNQNGVTRPRAGTATGRVWEIADELSEQKGEPADRADVLKAYEAEGGNSSTGATQFGRWRKFHGLGKYSATATTEKMEGAGAAEVETDEE